MEGYEKITGPKGGGYILKQHVYDTVERTALVPAPFGWYLIDNMNQ